MRLRRAVSFVGVTLAASVAMVIAAAAAPALASGTGPGYPTPGGIFAPFTNCPILNPLMAESPGGDATGCVAGDALYGSITIGPVTVPIAHPLTAQFGLWSVPGEPNQFDGGILPPPNGQYLVDSAEIVPGGLLKALGCPSATPAVETLCKEAVLPGESSKLTAKAVEAGQITNFGLTTWTQPIMLHLINPLLGNNCYIGNIDDPIVINPSITGTIGVATPTNTKKFPNLVVLQVTGASAGDSTFSVPVATGCGPGGVANGPIDTADSLPSPSGSNSLTLNGSFYLADCYAASHQAHELYEALVDSSK